MSHAFFTKLYCCTYIVNVRIIFGGGVYVDENTDQAASVRIVRLWRTISA